MRLLVRVWMASLLAGIKARKKSTATPKSEIMGKSISVLVPPELPDEMSEILSKIKLGEGIENYETVRQRKDGQNIYVSLTVSAVYDAEGRILGASTIARDITERKQMEKLLSDSEEQYRLLFETANDGILLIEKNDGEIVHINPSVEKMLGYSARESIGNKLQNIGLIIDNGDFQITMKKLNKEGILRYNDVPVKTKSGQHIYTDTYLVDKAKFAQCNIRYITERKQAEKELQESEEKYRLVVENTKESIIITQNVKVVFANNAAIGTIGYSKEILTSKSFTDFIHPDDLNMVVDHHIKRIKGEEVPPVYSFRVIGQDGTVIWCEINAVVIQWKGKPATLNFLNNITERKKAEEELQQTLDSLRKSVGATIQVMVSAVEMRDPYTAGHQIRTADLARAIATEMGLPKEKIDGIRMAGSIHDIGKLSIPAEILSKSTKLTDNEFNLIKEHSYSGYEMLKDVESPWPLAQIVYQHHERMDGSGYPRNLKGVEILIEARIMAVADVVEAMASHRP